MLYCEGKTKAIIKYVASSGQEIKHEFLQVPIEIDCADVPRTGRFIYTVRASGYNFGTCTPIGDRAFGLTVVADSYAISSAPPLGGYETCIFNDYNFYIATEKVNTFLGTSDAIITSIANPNYSPGGKYLTIKFQGSEIFKTQVKNCDYSVTCDDECPEGYLKCVIPEYPGYCCIPCDDIKSGIIGITAILKGINNG